MSLASEESEQLGQRYIGDEHVILGLLRGQASRASSLLRAHGLELSGARAELRRLAADGTADRRAACANSDGRQYYDKKIAEGKAPKEALRCLKRRISNAIYARLRADARHAAQASGTAAGPGGQPGNDSASSAAGSHPARQLFEPATPRPEPQPTTPRQPPAVPQPTAPKRSSKRT